MNGCSVEAVPTGMSRMIEPVARIRIELQDLEPKIWRRIDVPLSSTLAALNDIIQVPEGARQTHPAGVGRDAGRGRSGASM